MANSQITLEPTPPAATRIDGIIQTPSPSFPETLPVHLPAKTAKEKRKKHWIPPRIQGFEFCDQPWLKGVWREAYMDGLDFLFKLGGIYDSMHRPFSRWAKRAGSKKVLDLASGNGGPAETMLNKAKIENVSMPHINLTDRYPDVNGLTRIQNKFPNGLSVQLEPVNALTVAKEKNDKEPLLLSICSAFHHFSPKQARSFLRNATQNADGLFIMEVFERNNLTPLQPLLNLPLLMLAPFFSGNLKLSKVMMSTFIPIIPIMIIMDGVISALRSYRREEILNMLPPEAHRDWHWETGRQRYLGIFSAPYVCGYRKPKKS